MSKHFKLIPKLPVRIPILLSFGLLLTACNMHINEAYKDGIGYREARYAEISAMREYRQCRDQALELDTKAREEGSTARYLASARLIEICEAEVGPSAAKTGEEERMRAYGLSIQNYLKGGDVAKARIVCSDIRRTAPFTSKPEGVQRGYWARPS